MSEIFKIPVMFMIVISTLFTNIPDSYSTEMEKGYIFLGDSRTYGMNLYANIDQKENFFVVAKVGEGYNWLINEAEPTLINIMNSHPDIKKWIIVSNLGVNDLHNIDKYVSEYSTLISEYRNITLLVESVNPVEDGASVSNQQIDTFNESMRTSLDALNVDSDACRLWYMDVSSYLKEYGFSTVDKLHYTEETYLNIYNYICHKL